MADRNSSGEDYLDAEENFCWESITVEEQASAMSVTEENEPLSEIIPERAASYNTLRRRKRKTEVLGQTKGFINSMNGQSNHMINSLNCVESSSEITKENVSSSAAGEYEAEAVVEQEGEEEQSSSDRGGNRDGNLTYCMLASESRESDFSAGSFLRWIASIVIKAVEFQVGTMVHILSVSMWLLRQGCYIAKDPGRTISTLKKKLQSVCLPLLQGPYHVQPSIGRAARKFGWGCLWSSFIFAVLVMLILLAFGLGFLFMHNFVEKPIQMKEPLYFDYTKPHPVAFVPLEYCSKVTNLEDNGIKYRGQKSVLPRLIPPDHRVQVTVVLTLPESDYNRNLGMFQVKLEFLSAEGNILASSSQPCMLRFKSLPILFAKTFLFSASFLVGFTSESQTLHLHMMEFTETLVPTACLRVTIERRAEFPPGEGIPEIYSAQLYVNSELPWLKRIIWKWKWSLFIWVGMGFFAMGVLILLCCCRSIIFPRVNAREISNDEQNQN